MISKLYHDKLMDHHHDGKFQVMVIYHEDGHDCSDEKRSYHDEFHDSLTEILVIRANFFTFLCLVPALTTPRALLALGGSFGRHWHF